jgi:hypothetical protein
MLVKGLDGRSYRWSFDSVPLKSETDKSSWHLQARELINKLFPAYRVHEEVYLPGGGGYLDMYIPLLRLGIEVHGEQHYRFNSLFHRSKLDFFQAKRRDRDKQSWCELNGIALAELPFDKVEHWQDIISVTIFS